MPQRVHHREGRPCRPLRQGSLRQRWQRALAVRVAASSRRAAYPYVSARSESTETGSGAVSLLRELEVPHRTADAAARRDRVRRPRGSSVGLWLLADPCAADSTLGLAGDEGLAPDSLHHCLSHRHAWHVRRTPSPDDRGPIVLFRSLRPEPVAATTAVAALQAPARHGHLGTTLASSPFAPLQGRLGGGVSGDLAVRARSRHVLDIGGAWWSRSWWSRRPPWSPRLPGLTARGDSTRGRVDFYKWGRNADRVRRPLASESPVRAAHSISSRLYARYRRWLGTLAPLPESAHVRAMPRRYHRCSGSR